MCCLDALDHLHNFVSSRIDNVNAVAGAVGDVDARGAGTGERGRERKHEQRVYQQAASGHHSNLLDNPPTQRTRKRCPVLVRLVSKSSFLRCKNSQILMSQINQKPVTQ
jgi:hypothetical protein